MSESSTGRTPTWESSVLSLCATTLSAAGVQEPRFEAQLLVALALERTRAQIAAQSFGSPTAARWDRLEQLVRARIARTPFAYLRGAQWFYGLEFVVTPAVLIPRPETELLVDFALERLAKRASTERAVMDVGVGSGCVSIAILANGAEVQVTGTDTSADALDMARLNSRRQGVEARLRLVRTSLLDGLADRSAELIVSNPPYIPSAEIAGLQPEIRDWEPRIALDGGPDGLAVFRHLANDAGRVLKPGGWIAVEVGLGQAASVVEMFALAGFADVGTQRDFAGIERIVFGRRD